MRISISIVFLGLVAMGSASTSLLEALFDYNDPLQLDESKSKRGAESYAKGKAGKGSSKTNFFSQFNYDLGDDDEDQYEKVQNKDYGPDTEEFEQVDQIAQQKGDDQYDKDDSSQYDKDDSSQYVPSGQTSHKSDEQEQSSSNKDCPDDMPTYRMYSVLAGCGVPIEQGVVKIEIDSADDHNQQTLAQYVEQVDKEHQVDEDELTRTDPDQGPNYYNQETNNQQGSQIYSQTSDLTDQQKEESGQVVGQHSVETTGQNSDQQTDYLEEVYEEPIVQSSANDRIVGQEEQLLGQHGVQTGQITGQDTDEAVEELPFIQSSANDRVLGQEGVQTGQTDYEQFGGYGQISGESGQVDVQVGQEGQISGQYEQGQSGRIEQIGQTGQVSQHGQVSLDGDDEYDDFGLSEQLWQDSDESQDYNQVSGSDLSQTGRQEQIYVPGQQQVGGPELPERLYQQTGNDESYHLRSQSANDGGTPRRAGGSGVWVGPQQQGSRYNNYYGPVSPPRPSHIPSGTAGVGNSYNGGGPIVTIPHPNQIDIGKFSCVGRSEGYYVDYASDCRRFFRCAHGDNRVFEFQCGGGTKFDINTSQCGHAHEVHCQPYNM